MDRRALRERIAIERQQVARDLSLKRDLALWLDAKLTDIERKHRLDAKNSALLRAMAIKRFSKYTRASKGVSVPELAFWANSDPQNVSTSVSELHKIH